ncbi:MAG: hypothetical protein LBE21_02630 [Pseudomonadales bacterium]|jgi:hypothetical protein|nr:hypothetical protein [Pseudomonadales bacterium]
MTATKPDQTAASHAAPVLGMGEPPPSRRAQNRTNVLLWAIFLLLLILVGGVIFILPRYISPFVPEAAPLAVATEPPASAEPAQPLVQRQQAQAILEPLLALQDELERGGVTRWAEAPFTSVLALARQGDAAYAAQDYAKAAAFYQDAYTQLQALSASQQSRYDAAMAQAAAAITAGDAASATAAYAEALLLHPDSAQALAGKARAEVLTQVQALLAAGHKLQEEQQLEAAQAQYQEAQALDATRPEVLAALEGIAQALRERDFAAAMSRGYAALRDERAADAIAAFQNARRIKDAPEVSAALQQAQAQASQAALSAQIQGAQEYESAEAWNDALAAWNEVLALDPNLVEAQQGRQRSQSRANLDAFLNGLIVEPLLLADDSLQAQTSQVLKDAERIANPGPLILEQIQQIRALLAQAAVPVQVQVQSDGLTQVSLPRVGELGSFTSHTLSLKPGAYTLLGVRPGYRDVRVEFVVGLDGTAPLLNIVCDEAI